MNLNDIRKAIASIGDERKGLAAELEKKKRRREFLETAPLPRKEFAECLCSMIDRDGDTYPARLAQPLQHLARKPFYDWSATRLQLLSLAGTAWQEGKLPPEMLCFMFRNQLKEGLRAAVSAMDWPDDQVGPPLAERRKEIEQLDQDVEKLETQIAEIDDEAKKAGIKRLE